MQVYKYMDIGTAKLSKDEMEGIPHYLIDEFEPEEEFSVFLFQRHAKEYIRRIYEKGKLPIIAGGTGFYIQAVLYDIDFTENESDIAYREELEQLAAKKGSPYIHGMLSKVDPESAKSIHPNNKKRIIRALEYARLTSGRISEHNKEQRKKDSPYKYCYFALTKDRVKLYEDINNRVDKMIDTGLLEEVKLLAAKGYREELPSMQGLGYKQLISYLKNEITLGEAIDLIKKETRHYAKRQITWFRREKDVIWVDKDSFDDEEQILGFMIDRLKQEGILM
jgi:tRNA dimethylallyltransferase